MSGVEPFLMAAGTGAAGAAGAQGVSSLMAPDPTGMAGQAVGPGGGSPIMAMLNSIMQEQQMQKQMRQQELAQMLSQMMGMSAAGMQQPQQPPTAPTVGQPQVLPGQGF